MVYQAAIVGCGRIASDFDDDPLMKKLYGIATHAGGYKDNPRVELVAAADISPEKLQKFGKRWDVGRLYTDYKQMLKENKVDILSICTWNSTHLELLEQAAKSGVKAAFCEKPISNSIRNAERMIEIANANNIKLAVNHSRRWDELYQNVADLIKNGELGEIQQVSCYYTAGIANTCSHLFDVLRMFLGDAISVNALIKDALLKDDPNMDGYIRFKNGATAVIQSLDVKKYTIFEFDIYGTNGRLRIVDNGFNVAYWESAPSNKYLNYNELFLSEPPLRVEPKSIIKNAVQDIVDCLDLSRQPRCTGEDGIKALEIICAFHLSAGLNGMTVDLPLKNRDLVIKSK